MSNSQAGNSGVSATVEESVEESSPAGSAPLAVCSRSIPKCSTSGKELTRTSWLSPFNDLRAAINRGLDAASCVSPSTHQT